MFQEINLALPKFLEEPLMLIKPIFRIKLKNVQIIDFNEYAVYLDYYKTL